MQVFPVFAVADLEDALAFYCDMLGFHKLWSFGDPAYRAGVGFDGIEIHLVSQDIGAPPGPSVIYCHMDDVISYHRQLQSRGLAFALDLDVRPWGMRDFRICDPYGNRLGFASPT